MNFKQAYRDGTLSAKPVHLCLIFLSVYFIFGTVTSTAQETQGILAQLNQKMQELTDGMNKAQAEQVHFLSPTAFAEASNNLQAAKEDLQKGKDVKGISKRLTTAEDELKKALANAAEARKQLPHVIQAREDAIAAAAPAYAQDQYEEAEKLFTTSMREIETNDINGAIKRGKTAEEKFHDAELTAIKASIIDKVLELLKQAKDQKADKFAPIGYEKSQTLIAEAEEILNSNRNQQATAREKAEQAEYEARHAIYLSDLVQKNRKDDENWEGLILSYENEIRKVTEEFNIKSEFDAGIAEPVKQVHLAVSALKQDKKDLSAELTEKNAEIDQLRETVSKLEGELSQTKEQEAGLKSKLEAEKRKEERIKRVEGLFKSSEAIVLREGTNLVLRLVGLSFKSGKSEIEAQYFGLLSKVQRAIREFPSAKIVIEGHTDSRGHDVANLKLSQQRAEAVESYLVANMGMDESRVTSVGFGKSKPIASNETEDGRSKNRRIDLVLEIGEAGY
ncbi:OmpA family protein [candidate division KSB1 bacterium]|nr:OmpA family protein [candidate division KSB1 bacterium]